MALLGRLAAGDDLPVILGRPIETSGGFVEQREPPQREQFHGDEADTARDRLRLEQRGSSRGRVTAPGQDQTTYAVGHGAGVGR